MFESFSTLFRHQYGNYIYTLKITFKYPYSCKPRLYSINTYMGAVIFLQI